MIGFQELLQVHFFWLKSFHYRPIVYYLVGSEDINEISRYLFNIEMLITSQDSNKFLRY